MKQKAVLKKTSWKCFGIRMLGKNITCPISWTIHFQYFSHPWLCQNFDCILIAFFNVDLNLTLNLLKTIQAQRYYNRFWSFFYCIIHVKCVLWVVFLSDDGKCAPKELLSLTISFHNNKNINHSLEKTSSVGNGMSKFIWQILMVLNLPFCLPLLGGVTMLTWRIWLEFSSILNLNIAIL